MEVLSQVLPILNSILVSILLIILIILSIRGLKILNRLEAMTLEIEEKVASISKLLDLVGAISNITGKFADTVLDLLKGKLTSLLDRKNKKKESEIL